MRAFAAGVVMIAALGVITPPTAPAAPIGPNHVAVILFNFQNDTSEPLTVAEVEALMFSGPDSMAAYWDEVSGGLISVTGDVYGWVTIPFDKVGPCETAWQEWAAAAAAASGVDPSGYDQVLFVSPGVNGCRCGYGGANSWSYMGAGSILRTCTSHEMGHHFGLNHAARYRCFDANDQQVPMSDNCVSLLDQDDYGDMFDIMGNPGVPTRHLSSRNKMVLGILPPAEFPAGSLKTVLAPGTFTLAPSEEHFPGEIQTIRVPRTVDADCFPGDSYYLEFRQPYGTYFDDFDSTDPVVNGVTIRVANGHAPGFRSYLIDTVPGAIIDFRDAPLAAGRTFSDPVSGVSVETLSVGPAGASVAVRPPSLGPDTDGDAIGRCLDNCPAVANANQADADGDRIGDVCDACTSTPAQAWTRKRVAVSRLADGQPGNDMVRLKTRFTMATGSFSVNPLADGARLQLRTTATEPVLDATLPAGAYVPPGPGWRMSASGTTYTFHDGRPGGSGGVRKMIVKDRGAGAVEVTVVARDATLPLLPADAPLQGTIVLGGAGAGAAGECGQVRFPTSTCVTSATAIRCR